MDIRTVPLSMANEAARDILAINPDVIRDWEETETLPKIYGEGGAFLYLDMSDGRLFLDLDLDKDGMDFSWDSDIILVAHAEKGLPQKGDILEKLVEKAILEWRPEVENRAEFLIMEDRIDMLYRSDANQKVLYSYAGSSDIESTLEPDRTAVFTGKYRYDDAEGKTRMAEIPLLFGQAMAVLKNWKDRGQTFVTADGITSEHFDIRNPYRKEEEQQGMTL